MQSLGGGDNSLIMWDLLTGKIICMKENAHGDHAKIAVAPDGTFIVTCRGSSGEDVGSE